VVNGRLWVLFALPFAPVSCAEILSLEDAEIDSLEGMGSPEGSGGAVGGTSAGGSGGAGGTATSGGAGGLRASELCDIYCDTVMTNCTGPFAVYNTIEACRAVCGHLPTGQRGDDAHNTIYCRLHAAESAPTEPSFYCPLSGPGGNGICGENCAALCTLASGACVRGDREWPSEAACADECAGLPDLGTYTTDPAQEMFKGNHVQCRLFHVSAAALEDSDIHCGHVAGAPPCAPPSNGGAAGAPR
jgi:hypothetical protein